MCHLYVFLCRNYEVVCHPLSFRHHEIEVCQLSKTLLDLLDSSRSPIKISTVSPVRGFRFYYWVLDMILLDRLL